MNDPKFNAQDDSRYGSGIVVAYLFMIILGMLFGVMFSLIAL